MVRILIVAFFSVALGSTSNVCQAQSDAWWISKPPQEWPPIALINEVWYKNGERYIHPSFEYAATGFLIQVGTKTMAATVKHALWVAKTKSMNTVDLQNHLDRWIMHPKGNAGDSVVIGELINRDSTEILQGPTSSITQRDWILFTTTYVSPNIQPLVPRYTAVRPGEKIWYLGCPYQDTMCVIQASTLLEVRGNKIILALPNGIHLGGASGSPIIDAHGLLVGILGGSSIQKKSGDPALYGVSTNYLKKILEGKKPLNVPLIPMEDILKKDIQSIGITKSIQKYKKLYGRDSSHYTYVFSYEGLNKLAAEFQQQHKTEEALKLYKLSASEYSIPGTLMLLTKTYRQAGYPNKAINCLKRVLKIQPDHPEALKEMKELKQIKH